MANGNGNTLKIIGLVLTFAIIIGGWLVTWGGQAAEIDSMQTEVTKNTASRDTTIGLSKDVEYIKEDIKEIKATQEKQDEKLDKILEKLG